MVFYRQDSLRSSQNQQNVAETKSMVCYNVW